MKTEDEITTEIYHYIKQSKLAAEINGKIINGKDRQPNATTEDVVIKVAGGNLAQRQEAKVNVNIYVQDNFRNGQYEQNDERVPLLQRTAMDIFQDAFRTGDARVTIEQQKTYQSQNGREHVINNSLVYHIIND